MDAFKPTGIGQNAAKNVCRVTFSEALSTNPKLQAWDDYLMDTVLHKIFVGTTVNGDKSMVGGIGLTSAPSADWWPSSMTAGAAVDTASRLKGNDGFCLLSSTPPSAAGEVFFNMDYKFPSDIIPSDTLAHVIVVEYQWTGATPTAQWHANKGTEGTPDWQLLTPQPKGSVPQPGMTEIRPCDGGEGENGTGTYALTIPESGEEHPGEIWFRDYEA